MKIHSTELLTRLGDDELLIIDCRTPDDWRRLERTLPGALHLSQADLSECAHILPDDELIVLCGWREDGGDARRAQRLLQIRGRQAFCLEGGLQAWITAGYPTEQYGEPGWESDRPRSRRDPHSSQHAPTSH